VVAAIALAYPLALFLVVLALRYVGERWWLTGGLAYLPRLGFALPLPFIVAALVLVGERRLLASQAVALGLIVFPLMGLVLPGPTGGSGGAKLRVMSFNINSALGGADKIAAEVDRYSPDIVVMQEIGRSGEDLTQRLSARYPAVKVSTQFLVASRYPILSLVEPPRIPLYGNTRSPRFIALTVDTPFGTLALYDVHPISPREGLSAIRGRGLRRELLSGRLLAGANAPLLRANNMLRSLQVEAIAALAAREPHPVIIAGDTNLPGLSAIFRRNLAKYHDGFVDAGSGFGYTFPANKTPWMRIDRILASDTLRFVHFEVGDSKVSDHRSVIADLELRRR
jgi:vancomycin resistance protein VanJ